MNPNYRIKPLFKSKPKTVKLWLYYNMGWVTYQYKGESAHKELKNLELM